MSAVLCQLLANFLDIAELAVCPLELSDRTLYGQDLQCPAFFAGFSLLKLESPRSELRGNAADQANRHSVLGRNVSPQPFLDHRGVRNIGQVSATEVAEAPSSVFVAANVLLFLVLFAFATQHFVSLVADIAL